MILLVISSRMWAGVGMPLDLLPNSETPHQDVNQLSINSGNTDNAFVK